MTIPRCVYVVHCIDTEGPLHEGLDASFERLRAIFGIDLKADRETLRRLQAGEIDLGGLEGQVQQILSPHLIDYNDTWHKIDDMLDVMLSRNYRMQMPDVDGNGWIYSWFCVDHVDYLVNPRRRDIGYHNIFDHYRARLSNEASTRDALEFHYHPHPISGEAHRCATHWWAESQTLHQILSRRVIERNWFPSANRPGFHVTRPDSHWFLEQYLPFDYASQAVEPTQLDSSQAGLDGGRFGDWRRAPLTWSPYHPSQDDYQIEGSCRRWIARCLNVGTRYRLISEEHVRQAFQEAAMGRPVVLSVTNHDFRDMRPDVDLMRRLIAKVSHDFPGIPFKYAGAVDAMRAALALQPQPPCELNVSLQSNGGKGVVAEVTSITPTFGPQPWLALRTKSGRFHTDNFDIETPFHHWRYVFDDDTLPMDAIDRIGVAANNAYGIATVKVIDPATGAITASHWNLPSEMPNLAAITEVTA